MVQQNPLFGATQYRPLTSGLLTGQGLQSSLQPGMASNIPSVGAMQFDTPGLSSLTGGLAGLTGGVVGGTPAKSFIQPVMLPQLPMQIGTPTPVQAADTSSLNEINSLKTILSLLLTVLVSAVKGKNPSAKTVDETAGTTSDKGKTSNGQRKGPQAADDTSPPSGGGSTGVAEGKGWAKNVNVFTSSNAQQQTVDVYSGGKTVGGYLAELEKEMDKGKTLKDAHDSVKMDDKQTPMRNNANKNSLVPGKGGKAIVATGDGIGRQEAEQFAESLKKNYGMDVEILENASPNQLKAAMDKIGKEGGEQAMVTVLAHGAKDDSGNNNGNMAMGKGDGDQWLGEEKLQQMVNESLASNFDNVNVIVSSCFAGNYVQ